MSVRGPQSAGKRRRRAAGATVQSLTSSGPTPEGQNASLARRAEVRALLSGDRQRAGDRRGFGASVPLSTASYAPTWAARWYAFRLRHWYWFHGRGASVLRRRFMQAGLALVVGIACALAHGYLTPNAGRAAQAPARRATAVTVRGAVAPVSRPAPDAGERAETGRSVDTKPPADPPADRRLEHWLNSLSPRARVVRADVVAQGFHVRSARRARRLLESALSEGVGGAHAQAALAEACLRLGDLGCARAAVDEAIRIRPWRGGYRTLRRRVLTAAR